MAAWNIKSKVKYKAKISDASFSSHRVDHKLKSEELDRGILAIILSAV